MTIDELTHQLTEAARSPGHKVLTCAPDVAAALRLATPPAEPSPPGVLLPLSALMGVDITEDASAEPGRFRLVWHNACEVDAEAMTVDHSLCAVTAEGSVTA